MAGRGRNSEPCWCPLVQGATFGLCLAGWNGKKKHPHEDFHDRLNLEAFIQPAVHHRPDRQFSQHSLPQYLYPLSAIHYRPGREQDRYRYPGGSHDAVIGAFTSSSIVNGRPGGPKAVLLYGYAGSILIGKHTAING